MLNLNLLVLFNIKILLDGRKYKESISFEGKKKSVKFFLRFKKKK